MHLLGMDTPPSVIFTTAYDQHALDAFEVNAVDYLLKPIRKDRLANALTKAHKLTAKQIQEITHARRGIHTQQMHGCLKPPFQRSARVRRRCSRAFARISSSAV